MYQAVDKEAMLEEARQQNATIESYNRGIVVYSQDAVRGVQEIANFIYRTTTYVFFYVFLFNRIKWI